MDTDKKFKFLIWGGFALVTCVILAWPVVKLMTKGAPQELSLPEGAAKAFTSEQGETRSEAEGAPARSWSPAAMACWMDSAINPFCSYQCEARRWSSGSKCEYWCSRRFLSTSAKRW